VVARVYGIKMVGMMEAGAPICLDGVACSQIVAVSVFVIFPFQQKTQKMACKNTILVYHPWVPPHGYANRRWGNPARMQHNSTNAEGCVDDDLRADKL